MTRRPPLAPWTADRIPGGYVVRDANGQPLAYVYCRANEAEAMQAQVPRSGTRRAGFAVNIARLPGVAAACGVIRRISRPRAAARGAPARGPMA